MIIVLLNSLFVTTLNAYLYCTPKKAKKSDEVIDVDSVNSPQRVYAANPTLFLALHNTFPEVIKMPGCGSCGHNQRILQADS